MIKLESIKYSRKIIGGFDSWRGTRNSKHLARLLVRKEISLSRVIELRFALVRDFNAITAQQMHRPFKSTATYFIRTERKKSNTNFKTKKEIICFFLSH